MSTAVSSIDAELLARSHAYCQRLTRRAAANFYYGLKLMPEPKRSAMFALYAYMRLLDDIADEADGRSATQRLEALETWRALTRAALNGSLPDEPGHEIWPAFRDMVQRYSIRPALFDDAIDGQRQDLVDLTFSTFAELRDYCYRVAGVVGLVSIHIWGFEGGQATEALAVERGLAFQLTNILRDLREDAAKGRIYLPTDELRAMNVDTKDVRAGRCPDGFLTLMHSQIDRAQACYIRSAELESRIDPTCRPTLAAMTAIYRSLLQKIAARPQRVLSQRVSLSVVSKLRIGWRALRMK